MRSFIAQGRNDHARGQFLFCLGWAQKQIENGNEDFIRVFRCRMGESIGRLVVEVDQDRVLSSGRVCDRARSVNAGEVAWLTKPKLQNLKDRVVARQGGQFICLYSELTESLAYRSLSSGARCLLQEMMALAWPDRNGRLAMSHERAAGLVRCTKKNGGYILRKAACQRVHKARKG